MMTVAFIILLVQYVIVLGGFVVINRARARHKSRAEIAEENLADALRQLGYATTKQLRETAPEVPAKYDTMDLALAYTEHENGMEWGKPDHCDGCDLRHSRHKLPEGYRRACPHSHTAAFGAWFRGCMTCGHIWKRDKPETQVEADLRQLPF